MAYRDFLHDRRLSLCFVLALMAVLAPLLVLFGLKFGLVDTLAQRLVETPRTREIVGVGSQRYEASWFERIAVRPEVAFIIPNTRRIAASFSYLRNPLTEQQVNALQMIPTGPGDPLLARVPAMPARATEVVLAYPTARKLGVEAGARVEARVERRRDNRDESVAVTLTVVGVAPEAALPRDGVFVPLDLLVATEDYRDGIAVPRFDWPGEPSGSERREFARFRLYAGSIYQVAALRDALLEEGIEVRTQADEIETMQALDRNLSRVFWLIAVIGVSGFLASLAANLSANVERKRRELSVIRLLGFPTRSIVLFPITQSMLIGTLGAVGAGVIYFPVALTLNAWFASSLRSGELICRLLPGHLLLALLVTLVCSALAAGWAGFRVARIEPAEGIRDV
jgi:putative ABC transport system permease protein